ncbi:upf89.0 domain protein [Escherichia coli 2534-86]|nr:upf89.0 domain protein [Escherichia coli OK1180]EGW80186.1 upf89.0 domain protein [Escherichia coli 2534-86]
MGDWRFFISEPGIISIEDLPPGWGLLHEPPRVSWRVFYL